MGKTKDNFRIIKATCLIILFFLSACNPTSMQKEAPTQLPTLLGYCPTMEPIVTDLHNNHPNLMIVRYESASSALQALSAGSIDGVIVGRVARKNELSEGIILVRINDGFTLIAQQQAMIPFEDLANINVLTMAAEVEAEKLFPHGTNIKYFQDFNQMLTDLDQTSAILLHWSEVPEEYQLLIPIDGQGNKITQFRSGHFYYRESAADDLSSVLEEFTSNH